MIFSTSVPCKIKLLDLDQQAFPEVAGADAHRIEGLNKGKRFLHRFNGQSGLQSKLLGAGPEIAVIVEIADDPFPAFDDVGIGCRKMELPHQVIVQGRKAGQRLVVGRQFFIVRLGRTIVPAVTHLVEIFIPLGTKLPDRS